MVTARDFLMLEIKGLDIASEYIDLALKEAEQIILNYCNRTTVPWQLNFVWAHMAHDIIIARYASKDSTTGFPDSEIGSIRAGDMQITRSADFTTHRVNVDELTKIYASSLDNFRLFNWGL